MPLSVNLPYPVCYSLVRLVRWVTPPRRPRESYDQSAYFDHQYHSTEALRRRFMQGVSFEGRVVLDVGSGLGGRAPYWLERGAERVVCIDINRQELAAGSRIFAEKFPGLLGRVEFVHPDEVGSLGFADLAILFDCFEHLVDPPSVLRQCYDWLRPDGLLWIGSFGWYHYAASHCLGHVPIPWCQILFSERAIIRTIQKVVRAPGYVPNFWEKTEGIGRWDPIETLKDRPGEPLNMLSLRAVRKCLRGCPFEMSQFRVHGFSGRSNPLARPFSILSKIPVLNELFHSYYTALLTKRDECPSPVPGTTSAHRPVIAGSVIAKHEARSSSK